MTQAFEIWYFCVCVCVCVCVGGGGGGRGGGVDTFSGYVELSFPPLQACFRDVKEISAFVHVLNLCCKQSTPKRYPGGPDFSTMSQLWTGYYSVLYKKIVEVFVLVWPQTLSLFFFSFFFFFFFFLFEGIQRLYSL